MKNPIDALKEQLQNGFQFTGKDLVALRGPCVYLLLSAGVVEYVGMSQHGMERPFGRDHRHAHLADEVLIYALPTVAQARQIEQQLLALFRPVGNWQPEPSSRAALARWEELCRVRAYER